MKVQQLDTYGYRGAQDMEWGETTMHPTWNQIEAAIYRLDANEYAGLALHLNDRNEDDPATEYFSVCGGPLGYTFDLCVDNKQLTYVAPNATQRGDEIGIVRRDQGIWIPACNVCYDVERVVLAAKWFFQNFEAHPELSWGRFGLIPDHSPEK